MKGHILKHTKLIISLIIIVGFLGVVLINYYTYGKVIKDDIENISKLTSLNIYSEIDNELTKPIFVSLTMANDTFFKNWIYEEKNMSKDEAYIKKLQDYLFEIKSKYDYNSVFFVSSKTNRYYHYNGIHKSISQKNKHDIWYYDFINNNKDYDLDVDTDEAHNNTLTVFVNCKVKDSNGNLIGVVGVGVKMDQLRNLLKHYENNFDLKTYLIDQTGVVQVQSNEGLIEKLNIFDTPSLKQFQDNILDDKKTLITHWYSSKNKNNCIITRYVKNLDWYLVIEKDTSIIRKSFLSQLYKDFVIILCIIILLLMIISYLISYYNKTMNKLIKTDELTNMPNRRAFNEVLENIINKQIQKDKEITIFVFDIDHFKSINDNYGHLFGDYVITKIGHITNAVIDKSGFIARWGGDEFFGIIYKNPKESEELLVKMLNSIHEFDDFKKYNISLSIGATYIKDSDTIDILLNRADDRLYKSKTSGRNKITYL